MLFPPQETPFMSKHNLRRKTLISRRPWSAWTEGRAWYPRCRRKVSDVGSLKVQTRTAPHRSEGRDGKWAASLGSSQPRGPGDTRRALGMRRPASEPRKAVQRRSDSWSTQQQPGAAESRASRDLRPVGIAEVQWVGLWEWGLQERVWLLENPARYDGWAACVPAAVYLCVCVCAYLWVHVCLCVYVCACACTYTGQNAQESKVWECGCLTAHVGRAISLGFQTPKWSHPEMTEWVSQGRNRLQSAVSV